MKIASENIDIFLVFAQNINCRYKLEPPHRCGSNEYHNLCFGAKIRKLGQYTPAYPSFTIHCIRVGFAGVYFSRTCFPDDLRKYFTDVTVLNFVQMATTKTGQLSQNYCMQIME